MSRVATAMISLDALAHNLSVVKKIAANSRVLAVIKADAYGHGLLTVASALQGADGFAVAHIEEAKTLRCADVKKTIVLLQGFVDAAELNFLFSLNVEPVIHSAYQISLIEKAAVPDNFTVWLKIDTGMGRLGFSADDFADAWKRLSQIPQITNNIRVMSHFANADDLSLSDSDEQLIKFDAITAALDVEKSVANSAGLIGWQKSHYDWVRPGIMLYGVMPFLTSGLDDIGLKPVMTLKSQIIAINQIKKHQSIGYGSCWQADENTQVAVVGCGYGDGYPRHIAENTSVLIHGRRFPIVGRVSMDMLCVNLGQNHTQKVGDDVILWGEGLPVAYVADQAGTIAYELLCQVTARVHFESLVTNNG